MSDDSYQDIGSRSVRFRASHSSGSVRSQNIEFRVAAYASNSIYSCFQDRVGSTGIRFIKLLTM